MEQNREHPTRATYLGTVLGAEVADPWRPPYVLYLAIIYILSYLSYTYLPTRYTFLVLLYLGTVRVYVL